MSTAIKVEDLSKLYRLGEIGTGTISHDLHRWVAKLRGKEDPFLKIGESNDRTTKGGDLVYSLKDLNFEVAQGEAIGIIGRNGAGKSTLLKILSRVTSPTAGKIHIKGRVASLLEVGTGFHPELTGKENIYLNGAILGMRKKEIDRKLEAIVDFSGVERYISTPVKRYSSGMYVRLAFAVAAHLESEILIVDEVLAVGDADFQKKCLGKMGEVSRGEGRTVLFVSHNMPSIKALCSKVIILKQGTLHFQGTVPEAIERYFESEIGINELGLIPENYIRHNTGEARFTSIVLLDENNQRTSEVCLQENLKFVISLDIFQALREMLLDLKISTPDGIVVSQSMNILDGAGVFSFDEGRHELVIELENILQPGSYNVHLGIHHSSFGTATVDYVENVLSFTVNKFTKVKSEADQRFHFMHGFVRPKTKWLK